MTENRSYGVVHGPRAGEISRRGFMRRMLGIGTGILGLQFLGGTVAFLWPNLTEGLGAEIALGTAEDIVTAEPEWPQGLPYIYNPANLFVINMPASRARVADRSDGAVQADASLPVADPGDDVMALWRKCPHLGCQVPQLCEASQWFECLCHGSQYTVLGEHRAGPAPRGMDRFPVTRDGDTYIVNTREVESGPPPGTVTFDDRAPGSIPHCTG
jgi:cytochrome b6-f complex iron-sulfur subunit